MHLRPGASLVPGVCRGCPGVPTHSEGPPVVGSRTNWGACTHGTALAPPPSAPAPAPFSLSPPASPSMLALNASKPGGADVALRWRGAEVACCQVVCSWMRSSKAALSVLGLPVWSLNLGLTYTCHCSPKKKEKKTHTHTHTDTHPYTHTMNPHSKERDETQYRSDTLAAKQLI